ncbi:ROK family transcriptional regulator [Microbispora sp. H11081]|uniref:ROK family transcriptional regulator n=1 Tax=Microbispora sp. H11081 TaxID=2729107 RepID=UPI0014750CBC|nr:ROK family transcriptional regulator [Microbispora sp. H11081]
MTQALRHDAMRARNLALVLGAVGARGSVTRAALAEITGLTKTTVSKLVADLIEGGLVVEAGTVRDGERGRPGVEIRISGRRVAALGIEVNVDYLAVCVVDLARTVRLRRTQAVDNRAASPVDVIARLGDLAAGVVDEAVEKGLRVVGGVLAVPGPVDMTSGIVHNAPNLGWRDVPLASLTRFPFPVRVENEANLAALGELWFGSGLPDFLHVSGEIGIGAGLVVRGTLFRGAHGLAGELGHIVVSPGGPPCRCGGRGCLEQYAGQDAILTAVRGTAAPAGPAVGLRPVLAPGDVSGDAPGDVSWGAPAGTPREIEDGAAQERVPDDGRTVAPTDSMSIEETSVNGVFLKGPDGAAGTTSHAPDDGTGATPDPGDTGTKAAADDGSAARLVHAAAWAEDAATSASPSPEVLLPAQQGLSLVLARLREGDENARAACERAAWALGVALSSAVNLVDPDAIVLGGIYAPLFPWIGHTVADTLKAHLGQMRGTVPPVVVSRLGAEAAALGAAGQVIEQVMADPAALLQH